MFDCKPADTEDGVRIYYTEDLEDKKKDDEGGDTKMNHDDDNDEHMLRKNLQHFLQLTRVTKTSRMKPSPLTSSGPPFSHSVSGRSDLQWVAGREL